MQQVKQGWVRRVPCHYFSGGTGPYVQQSLMRHGCGPQAASGYSSRLGKPQDQCSSWYTPGIDCASARVDKEARDAAAISERPFSHMQAHLFTETHPHRTWLTGGRFERVRRNGRLPRSIRGRASRYISAPAVEWNWR